MIFRSVFALFLTFLSAQLFAFDELKFAASLGLELVSEGHPYNYLGINTIYVNDNMTRQMLVVSSVPGDLKETRIYKQKGFLIVEIPKGDSSYVSMALVGISEEEIQKNIQTTSVFRKIWNELVPIRNAYSEECGISGMPNLPGLESLQKLYDSNFAKGALKCISNFLQGFWDSTGGMVADAAEGIKNLISDPKQFWNRKVEEFNNLKKFISNFSTEMSQMAEGIANLPDETKTMLICSFVGGIGGDAAMAILAGGAGLGKLIFRMEQYVSKIARLNSVFKVLNKVGRLKTIPIGFFERLSSSSIPDRVIDNLTVFAHHNLPDVIQGAMSCAL